MRACVLGLLVLAGVAVVSAAQAQTPQPPAPTASSAAVAPPDGAHRLQMIAAPRRLQTGRLVNVWVSDAWGLGGISARVCARSATRAVGCRVVRLAAGQRKRRLRLRLPAAGRWRISLRSPVGQRLTRRVAVRRNARMRVLASGDSMMFGIVDALGGQLRGRGGATVIRDTHGGTGITLPPLHWPAHARQRVRAVRPDVSIVILGAATDSYPLRTPSGPTVACCGPAWVDAYTQRVRAMMATFLQDGRGLVYWVLLPPHRDPVRNANIAAVNRAIRTAAAGFVDGVRLVDEISKVLAPDGVFTASIVHRGVRRVVRRVDDGMHLATYGVRIAAAIVLRILRRDGLR